MTSDLIASGRKYRYQFATGGKLILFKLILSSTIFVNNRVIVIENRQNIFQVQSQQNRVINYNFVNYNYNFSKTGADTSVPRRSLCAMTFPLDPKNEKKHKPKFGF